MSRGVTRRWPTLLLAARATPPRYAERLRAASTVLLGQVSYDAGLVDELHLTVGPGVVGSGVRSFTGRPRRLQLTGTRTFPGSSLLLTVYRPEPAG